MVDLSLHNFWRKSKAKPRVTGQEVSVCKLHNRNSAHQINARRAPQCFYVFDSVRVRSKARANCYDPIVTSTIILWSVDIHFAFEFAVLRNTLDKVATAVFSFSESVFFLYEDRTARRIGLGLRRAHLRHPQVPYDARRNRIRSHMIKWLHNKLAYIQKIKLTHLSNTR